MKISIIVPIFNSEKHLSTCLNSLLSQTLEEIEVITIDDASTDNSYQILRHYQSLHPTKLKVFKNEQNIGQGATRNKGIALAKGDYIGFVDSDDYIALNCFELMYENAYRYGYPDIVTTNFMFVHNDNKAETFADKHKPHLFTPSMSPSIVIDNSPACWNKIFRRDILEKGLFLENVMWEDISFTYFHMLNAKEVVSANDFSYFYRQNPDGITASSKKLNPRLLDIFKVTDHLEELTKRVGIYENNKNFIRTIQMISIYLRIEEILKWNIPYLQKEQLCQLLLNLAEKKIGTKSLEEDCLNSRISILTLDYCARNFYDLELDEQETKDEITRILARQKI